MVSTTDDETPKNLNDAHALIQHAMENVKQELLIIDKSGKSHLVYIFDAHIHDGKLHVDYKAVNENDEIHQLVHEAMNAQINQIMKEDKEKEENEPWWKRIWLSLKNIFWKDIT
uniref:Initiator of head vertex n=1 Tax=Aeromonas phage Aes120 TaxID=1198017 RepID=I6ZIH2_9CAUD|nr:initiator of head vertex [Aeromonas phage Aes120]